MKLNLIQTVLILLLCVSVFGACESDDNAQPTPDFLDVEWTAADENGTATIIFRTDGTWSSTNTVTNNDYSGEWSWVDEGSRIMKFREFIFFEDTFSEFYKFSNLTDTSVDVEFTTQPNPNQPNSNSYFTVAGTWMR